MFITKKEHNKKIEEHKKVNVILFKQLEEKEAEIKQGYEKHIEIVAKLEQEIKEARDLKLILEKLYPLYSMNGSVVGMNGSSWNLNLPDTVLQYTEDILGGKVIKQEGTKCLVVDKDGNVKTGLTKQKSDKGYSYKLVRN